MITAARRAGHGAAKFCGVFLFATLGCAPAFSQDFGETPYVQTPQSVVDKMLDVAKVGPKDYVIDLGSGDGRMIITAAKKYGARGFGVDLDKQLVKRANELCGARPAWPTARSSTRATSSKPTSGRPP